MATIVADTFTRANSASVVGGPETGTPTPTSTVGTWGINGNQLYCSAVASSLGLVSWDCATVDVDISVDIATLSTNSAAIAFGITSATDYWRALFTSTTNGVILQRVAASGTTLQHLDQFAAPSALGLTARLVCKSGVVAVYLGGNQLGRMDLKLTGVPTATKCGVFTTNTTTRFDNLSIVDSSTVNNAVSSTNLYKGRTTALADASGGA